MFELALVACRQTVRVESKKGAMHRSAIGSAFIRHYLSLEMIQNVQTQVAGWTTMNEQWTRRKSGTLSERFVEKRYVTPESSCMTRIPPRPSKVYYSEPKTHQPTCCWTHSSARVEIRDRWRGCRRTRFRPRRLWADLTGDSKHAALCHNDHWQDSLCIHSDRVGVFVAQNNSLTLPTWLPRVAWKDFEKVRKSIIHHPDICCLHWSLETLAAASRG